VVLAESRYTRSSSSLKISKSDLMSNLSVIILDVLSELL